MKFNRLAINHKVLKNVRVRKELLRAEWIEVVSDIGYVITLQWIDNASIKLDLNIK